MKKTHGKTKSLSSAGLLAVILTFFGISSSSEEQCTLPVNDEPADVRSSDTSSEQKSPTAPAELFANCAGFLE